MVKETVLILSGKVLNYQRRGDSQDRLDRLDEEGKIYSWN
jgi:hypothetical protein